MRRLKKADCEVDFFFIDEVGFSLRSRVSILSVMPKACQHFFNFFTRYYPKNSSQPGGRTSKKALGLVAAAPSKCLLPPALLETRLALR